MSLTLDHVTLGQRVLFGTGGGAANLATEVARLGAQRVMVFASDRETEMARTVAADIKVARWHHDVVMHVPIETAEKARASAAEAGVDLLVCVGGGSTTGLAKAVAMTSRLPIIAVPTTYLRGLQLPRARWQLIRIDDQADGPADQLCRFIAEECGAGPA